MIGFAPGIAEGFWVSVPLQDTVDGKLVRWAERRWLVPLVVVLALPVLWLNGFAVLAAVVPLWQGRAVAATASRNAAAPAGATPA